MNVPRPSFLVLLVPGLLACGGGGSTPPTPPPPPLSTWTQLASAPAGCRGAYGFAVLGAAYVVSGTRNNDTPDLKCWRYDSTTNAWSDRAPFPGLAVLDGAAFAVGTKGYVAFGHNNSSTSAQFSNECWEYDTVQNAWTRKRAFPGPGRSGVSAVVINQKAYFFGGTGTSWTDPVRELWEYDPAGDTWTRKADPPASAFGAAAFSIGGKGYFWQGGVGNRRFFLEYDAGTDTWTSKADCPTTTTGGALGLNLGPRGYLLSGFVNPNPFVGSREVWEYDPATNAWTRKPDTEAQARGMGVGFVIGSELYLGLGMGGALTDLSDLWRWRP